MAQEYRSYMVVSPDRSVDCGGRVYVEGEVFQAQPSHVQHVLDSGMIEEVAAPEGQAEDKSAAWADVPKDVIRQLLAKKKIVPNKMAARSYLIRLAVAEGIEPPAPPAAEGK